MIITKAGDLSVEQVPQMHLGVCQNFKPEGPQDTTAYFYPCIYPLVNIQKTLKMAHLYLIYLIKTVMFHSYVNVYQRVSNYWGNQF
jgi:hypothetical protein